MHQQAFAFVERHARRCEPRSVLEIGSLDINGSVRPLFRSADRYLGLDLVAGPGVDVVADAADWSPGRERFDLVVSAEVLEHAPRWADVLATAWHALEPGGELLVTCATDPRPPHSAVDGLDVRPDEHYENVAGADVEALVQTWSAAAWTLEVHADRGDLYLAASKRC